MKTVKTQEAPAAIGPYSQAIVVDGWVFVSGQIPFDPATGQLVGGPVGVQTERVLANLRAILEAAGSSFARVVRSTVYLVDLGAFEEMNAAYARAFGEHRPARSTVQVAALPRGAAVEIDVIARLDS
jgi:2-iminobutanoate/2-iminopropanoate deaminase